MSAREDSTLGLKTARDSSRRPLLIFASSATASAYCTMRTTLRGVIIQGGLSRQRSPFTFSLLIYTHILPGIYLTARGRDVAGYHLFVAVAGLALLGTVHFAPTAGQESRYTTSTWSTRVPSRGCSRL